MKSYLEHVQFVVSNLDVAIKFYCGVFGWEVRGRGKEVAADRTYYWVHVGTETSYIAFRTPYDGEPFHEGLRGYKGNHLGIVTDDLEGVLRRLQELGRPIRSTASHPYRARFYVRDFDDNEIEVVHYLTDDIAKRNDYEIDRAAASDSQRV